MTPDALLARAQQAIRSAYLLMESGDKIGAVNRAYYAMFDSARGALMTVTESDLEQWRTHKGLTSAFHNHLIKNKLLPLEEGRNLSRILELRIVSDYSEREIDIDICRWAVLTAENFVAACRAVILNRSTESPAP